MVFESGIMWNRNLCLIWSVWLAFCHKKQIGLIFHKRFQVIGLWGLGGAIGERGVSDSRLCTESEISDVTQIDCKKISIHFIMNLVYTDFFAVNLQVEIPFTLLNDEKEHVNLYTIIKSIY